METGVSTIDLISDVASKCNDAESMLCIWLVDDDAYCCEHLTWILSTKSDVKSLRSFSSVSSLLAALRQESPPDAIVMDVQMPIMNGIEAILPIKKLASSCRVLILTTFFDQQLKELALAAGAVDFLLKRNASAQIINAIR
jgi:DNA-binding NarL/FixJ family response regulator